ncbi:hypothetical protein ACSEE7_19445 [Halomonas cupida]|uniref:hypothetical protein n=1 Tax=Halomonas TaxID=2745 RepID=UPI001A9094A0|nr:hypothetical protein [Halomonas litopenaei]MBN8413807.1 hypothetical protein [Halomonas litopenaei]
MASLLLVSPSSFTGAPRLRAVCVRVALGALLLLAIIGLIPHGEVVDVAIWVGICNAMLLFGMDAVLGLLLESLGISSAVTERSWLRTLLAVMVAVVMWVFAIFLLPLALACRHLRGQSCHKGY